MKYSLDLRVYSFLVNSMKTIEMHPYSLYDRKRKQKESTIDAKE